jgi:hypothetical protein
MLVKNVREVLMKKNFIVVVMVGVVVGMLLWITSTFAHAERRCVDDHGVRTECPNEYNNYQPDSSTDGYYNNDEYHHWNEHRHSRYDEPYYHNYDEWEYEQPRRRKLKLRFRPSIILRIY